MLCAHLSLAAITYLKWGRSSGINMQFLFICHDLSDLVGYTSWDSYKTVPLSKLVFYFWIEYSLTSKLLSI